MIEEHLDFIGVLEVCFTIKIWEIAILNYILYNEIMLLIEYTTICKLKPLSLPRKYILTNSGVRRKLLRGPKFRHNCVTSQITPIGSAESTTIPGRSGGMPRKNFARLHLKIRIFLHSGSKF